MASFVAVGPARARALLPLLLLGTASSPVPEAHDALAPRPPASLRLAGPGVVVRVGTDPFTLSIRDGDDRELLASAHGTPGDGYGGLAWTTGTVRYETIVSPGYTRFIPSLDPWHDHLRVVTARAGDGTLELELDDPRAPAAPRALVRLELAGVGVRVSARLEGGAVPRAWAAAFTSPPDEGFLGMGERWNRTDQRGRDVFSWAEEGGIGTGEGDLAGPQNPYPSGETMTAYPVPYFLSTRGYGFWLDTTWRSELNLASQRSDAWRAWEVGPTFAFEIHLPRAGDPRPWPLQLVDRFTAATGRPMLPPPWAFGPRRRVERHAQQAGVPELQALRDRDLAVTAVDDALHFLPAGSHVGREAELAAWTAHARSLGYRVNGYFNTMVDRAPQMKLATWAAEGRAQDAFLRRWNRQFPHIWVMTGNRVPTLYLVDFTSAAATAWYQRAFEWAFELGYSGFMYDFGEYVPSDAWSASGLSGAALHNLYPVLQARAAYEALERGPRAGDWLAFMRSGYTGSSAFVPMAWSGDPAASFEDSDGLPAMVRAGVNLGISGVPHWGSDIGGYHCLADGAAAADEELLVRWIQLAALTPNMQDQDACAGGDARQKASIWSSEAVQMAWRRYARLHTRLFPYLYTLAHAAHASGAPLMRHVFLEHPGRTDLRTVDDVFYLGPALLVAPVVVRGAREKRVDLPDPLYLDWSSRALVRGRGPVVLSAPLADLPLLLRAGHLVPLLDASIDTLAEEDAADVVGPGDVAGVYDVVALLEPGQTARSTLWDGTQLEARRHPGGAASTELAVVRGEEELEHCDRCVLRETRADGVVRVRVSVSAGRVDAGGLELTSTGARRIRWDVYLAP